MDCRLDAKRKNVGVLTIQARNDAKIHRLRERLFRNNDMIRFGIQVPIESNRRAESPKKADRTALANRRNWNVLPCPVKPWAHSQF